MSEEEDEGKEKQPIPHSRFIWQPGDLEIVPADEVDDDDDLSLDDEGLEFDGAFGIPLEVEPHVLTLVADVVELAASHGDDRWGLTDFSPYMRVNVGWTEIVTTVEAGVRLIVDGELAVAADPDERVHLFKGKSDKGYYPSIKGSLLAEIPYEPADELIWTIAALRPAVERAIALSAKRRATPAIRKAHSPARLRELSEAVGRDLPTPRPIE